MSTLTITRTYADTVDLTEAQLDAANDSIETWANGNIGSTNLAVGGVSADNLAAGSVTTTKLGTASVTLAKLASDASGSLFQPGMILPYAAASAPTGFLLCDGAAVSRT